MKWPRSIKQQSTLGHSVKNPQNIQLFQVLPLLLFYITHRQFLGVYIRSTLHIFSQSSLMWVLNLTFLIEFYFFRWFLFVPFRVLFNNTVFHFGACFGNYESRILGLLKLLNRSKWHFVIKFHRHTILDLICFLSTFFWLHKFFEYLITLHHIYSKPNSLGRLTFPKLIARGF